MIITLLYPFIFSLFPTLSLYLANYNEVYLSEVVSTSLLLLVSTIPIYIGSYIPTRDLHKSSLLTFIFLFFTFSFQPVFYPFFKFIPLTKIHEIYFYYFLAWIFLFCLSIISVLWRKNVHAINKLLAFVSIFLVTSTLINIGVKKPWASSNKLIASNEKVKGLQVGDATNENLPDIYYIVMDRYNREDILKKNYKFDNSPFISFLKDKGFYVAEKSQSNYLRTALSLTSSLNMKYLNYLSEKYGEDTANWTYLYNLIEYNEVAQTLKSKGYKFIHVGTSWEPTRKNRLADVNVNVQTISEFSDNIFANTVFYPIKDWIFSEGVRKKLFNRAIFEFSYMKSIPEDKSPTFTFAHFLITHPPFVFDQNGKYLSPNAELAQNESETYIMQVQSANRLLEELVNEILTKSETPPIIIIQADEGTFPPGISQLDYKFNWFEAKPDHIEEKLSILNAIYIPNVDTRNLRPDISPVNTFRIVFNTLFDANLELLPNESYLNQDQFHLFKFRKVE